MEKWDAASRARAKRLWGGMKARRAITARTAAAATARARRTRAPARRAGGEAAARAAVVSWVTAAS